MNGVAVALQLVEPAPAPSEDIEQRIGAATVFAVGALSKGLVEFWEAGRLSPQGKALGTEAVMRLFELQQSAPGGFDFFANTVRREGLRMLRARHAALQEPQVFPEAWAAEIIDELLATMDRVERAMAH